MLRLSTLFNSESKPVRVGLGGSSTHRLSNTHPQAQRKFAGKRGYHDTSSVNCAHKKQRQCCLLSMLRTWPSSWQRRLFSLRLRYRMHGRCIRVMAPARVPARPKAVTIGGSAMIHPRGFRILADSEPGDNLAQQ
jgi:hypothetical protein